MVLAKKMITTESANFGFLCSYDLQLVRLGALAERYFRDDPNTCLIKLRQFGELLAQLSAAKTGFLQSTDEPQAELLRRLKLERVLSPEITNLFHQIRIEGNKAAHNYQGEHSQALTCLKMARHLGLWFHRTFSGDITFKIGPFVPPQNPLDATKELTAELQRLKAELEESRTQAERARQEAEDQKQALLNAEEKARQEADERLVWEQLAEEAEQARSALVSHLATLQENAQQSFGQQQQKVAEVISLADQAASTIDLDEDETRAIIDQQLRDAKWLADSRNLTYRQGVRPSKGQNMAIAEYPTSEGIADYALFIGTNCIAIVEAKRKRKNVSAAIDQAERYAKGFKISAVSETIGEGAWSGDFHVPFVFATNGRPYLKQIETQSGIWFRDVRKSTNLRRALVSWYTPDGLKGLLSIDQEEAHNSLKKDTYRFGFPLRPYQCKAIEIIESNLEKDRRTILVAMATGTGKTKLAIAMLYRLLSAKRFRRICFVVDRSALGDQVEAEFSTTKVVSAKTFADIYALQGLKDPIPELETKVHICTIQGLVKRILYANEPAEVPPVDQYDLLVIDECHRGYLLDKEMSDAELSFCSQEDYISKYRRVLEYFDAVKIGLTATPALHTVEIFGEPVFTYSYREAVIDGYLIDHEPPIEITTALSQQGINFSSGEQIESLNTITGEINLAVTSDNLNFDVAEFNKKVITVAFNQTVAQELAKHIDPYLPGKTLIFATTDAHADIVVEQVKKSMEQVYGEIEDGIVRKITSSVDRARELIRSYKNDSLPKIAVTVDLLTTGIDVPSITNLVFLRRVNSRILYEQMLGRATRQCDEIGKETFRIFDAVDLYSKLQNLTQMKPVVVEPKITFSQLFDELVQVTQELQLSEIRDQILVKLKRKARKISDQALVSYLIESGETPEQTLERFRTSPLPELTNWLRERPNIGLILDWNPEKGGANLIPISHHPDAVLEVTRGYGSGQKPDDFLDSFTAYIRNNINKMAALIVVTQSPRDLTRAQLRELRLELDKIGFSETALRQAWQATKNEDIAESIIGYIRQAALGDPIVSYDERVKKAMKRILSKRVWTVPQRKWLERIGEQITHEFIMDRKALDQEPFEKDGGFKRLNRIFEGQLEVILGDINEELWKRTA
jgi:type I restriction enzyme, R subunit